MGSDNVKREPVQIVALDMELAIMEYAPAVRDITQRIALPQILLGRYVNKSSKWAVTSAHE